jgi:MerR family redox-sensitive transcriptional activator SoxR
MTETRITIGAIAERTGLSISAIRFYETQGLITPSRNSGGQRRFLRSDIRRLSFVQIAQQLGFSIDQIRQALHTLPNNRTPNQKDWARISRTFRADLETRIGMLTRMRDRLDGCIGCGCLSLEKCALYNPKDKAGLSGSGPQFVLHEQK